MRVDVSARIKRIRKDRKVSQYKLAKKSGISQSFLSTLESGKKIPTVSTLEKLCDALRISLSEFFRSDTIQPGTDQNYIPPYLYQLLEATKPFTCEQLEKLTDFLNCIKNNNNGPPA